MAEKITITTTKRKVYRFATVNRATFIKTFNRLARHGYVWDATARVRKASEVLAILKKRYGWDATPYTIIMGDADCTRVVMDVDDYCHNSLSNEVIDVSIDRFIKQKLYEA